MTKAKVQHEDATLHEAVGILLDRRVRRLVPERTVAALCVAPNSGYKQMADVECYDQARDVRMFAGGMPVVAHPPCRAWSAYTAHQAKPAPGEKELGLLCADWLRIEGGVLEHPAHSRLFEAARLPRPGQRIGDLCTMLVWQAWWGYPMRKATWLCFSRVDVRLLDIPYIEHDSRSGKGDRRRQQLMSKHQRAETCPALAEWLVVAARKTPNVRGKLAPTAWRAGQQAQNGPQALRLMASAARR